MTKGARSRAVVPECRRQSVQAMWHVADQAPGDGQCTPRSRSRSKVGHPPLSPAVDLEPIRLDDRHGPDAWGTRGHAAAPPAALLPQATHAVFHSITTAAGSKVRAPCRVRCTR